MSLQVIYHRFYSIIIYVKALNVNMKRGSIIKVGVKLNGNKKR